VPVVARRRKNATGGLDDQQLPPPSDRLAGLRRMDRHRAAIPGSIRDPGKRTAAQETAPARAATKAEPVRIKPNAIGAGRSPGAVAEHAVNAVGVDPNTAPAPLCRACRA
jgi:uncharacterized protein